MTGNYSTVVVLESTGDRANDVGTTAGNLSPNDYNEDTWSPPGFA